MLHSCTTLAQLGAVLTTGLAGIQESCGLLLPSPCLPGRPAVDPYVGGGREAGGGMDQLTPSWS
jgi:hypothetical protein